MSILESSQYCSLVGVLLLYIARTNQTSNSTTPSPSLTDRRQQQQPPCEIRLAIREHFNLVWIMKRNLERLSCCKDADIGFLESWERNHKNLKTPLDRYGLHLFDFGKSKVSTCNGRSAAWKCHRYSLNQRRSINAAVATVIFLMNCHIICGHDYVGEEDLHSSYMYEYYSGRMNDDERVDLEDILQNVRTNTVHHEMAYEQLLNDSFTVQKINIINAEISQNSSSLITEKIVRQRYLLVVFYLDTDGENWTFCSANGGYCGSIQWISGLHNHCSWHGIDCDYNNLVLSIDIQDNNLSGAIQNSTIFDETFNSIAAINLSANRLYALPDSIDNLKNLKKLDLDHNYFYGNIPSSIYNLSNLQILDLHANEFFGTISPMINRLQSVETILLHENNLSGEVPEEYLELSKLSTFKIQDNQFENEIPCDASSSQLRIIFADCPVLQVRNEISMFQGVTCECCAQCFYQPDIDVTRIPNSAPTEPPSDLFQSSYPTNHPTLPNVLYVTNKVENTSGGSNNQDQLLHGLIGAGVLLALFGMSTVIIVVRGRSRRSAHVFSQEDRSNHDFLENSFDDELPEWVMPPPPSLEENENCLQ